MQMTHLRNGILAGVLSAILASGATAATTPASAPHPAPMPKPSPELAAAMKQDAAPASVAPKPVPATLPTMSAPQIAERNAAARGGLAAWQRIHSMTLSGKLDAGKQRKDGAEFQPLSKQERAKARTEMRKALAEGKLDPKAQQEAEAKKIIQLPFQMDLQRPRMMRLEVPVQGQAAVQVYDGAHGWKLRPYLGRHEVENYSEEELKLAADQQELDGPLINFQSKGTRVEVEGGEMVDGRGAYRLKLTFKDGDVQHLWVDAQTFLDVKLEGTPRRWGGKMHTVTTWFRDYKPVGGLMIAHRLETQLDAVPGSKNIYVEKVVLNPPLDAKRFTKPL
jgi:hypothetical protein